MKGRTDLAVEKQTEKDENLRVFETSKENLKITTVKISRENNEKLIGKEIEVLLENITEDGKYYIGRSTREVPDDTDGTIYIENTTDAIIGSFAKVKIVEALDYDLIANFNI